MVGADVKNEAAWANITGEAVAAALARKKKPTDRLRLMSRGEALAVPQDVYRVADICAAVAPTMVWLPTRAWRDPMMRALCEGILQSIPNLALLASTDPTNTPAELADLKSAGWSTMFFGDDADTDGRFLCPKTWRKRIPKGHCSVCKAGCFAKLTLGRRVDVHLREH